MDFKWTLSRPGISLEFETGSIKEALGLLEQEGTTIQDVFGFTTGHAAATSASDAPEAPEAPKTRKPRTPKPEAVAPDPLPVPAQEAAPSLVPTPLPPNALNTAPPPLPPNQLDTTPGPNGVPAFLDASNRAAPPLPTPPPVGTLGPKMVAMLDAKAKDAVDGGQALADWLAQCGLTIKGKNFTEACRAVLMISDEKLGPAAAILGIS